MIVLTAIAVGWMLVFFARSGARHPVIPAALGLLIGGSVSNLVDRVRLGHVTDFLDFGWWPAFNLADTFIVVGVGDPARDAGRRRRPSAAGEAPSRRRPLSGRSGVGAGGTSASRPSSSRPLVSGRAPTLGGDRPSALALLTIPPNDARLCVGSGPIE